MGDTRSGCGGDVLCVGGFAGFGDSMGREDRGGEGCFGCGGGWRRWSRGEPLVPSWSRGKCGMAPLGTFWAAFEDFESCLSCLATSFSSCWACVERIGFKTVDTLRARGGELASFRSCGGEGEEDPLFACTGAEMSFRDCWGEPVLLVELCRTMVMTGRW